MRSGRLLNKIVLAMILLGKNVAHKQGLRARAGISLEIKNHSAPNPCSQITINNLNFIHSFY